VLHNLFSLTKNLISLTDFIRFNTFFYNLVLTYCLGHLVDCVDAASFSALTGPLAVAFMGAMYVCMYVCMHFRVPYISIISIR